MDLSGAFPKLTDADSVYALKEYSERMFTELDKMPRGIVARSNLNGSTAGIGAAVMVGLVAVPLVAGRWYKVEYVFTSVAGGPNDAIAYDFKKSAVNDSTANGTSLNDGSQRFVYTGPAAGNSKTETVRTMWKATSNETQNIKAILARATGSVAFTANSRGLYVFDMGTTAP
ncbi:hypothetical protein SEA_DEWAYNE_15 [Arthrobacter phage Dewayne]|uniref:Uncharacterized protein n=1 Tax=Arthrobacter phage Dewayne TaxID=2283241 RepID=A0A345M4H8_9CAUD|nr:hypothetical protein SEA_DEWAYNE_15 [Arthrobacter phage Dewayne]